MNRLIVLNSTGDITISWDHTDPARVAEARETVAKLKADGYQFYLADGSQIDEVAAGAGSLLVRKMTAEEVVAPPASPQAPPEPVVEADPVAAPRRRGRPPKNAPPADQTVVAVRPVRGG